MRSLVLSPSSTVVLDMQEEEKDDDSSTLSPTSVQLHSPSSCGSSIMTPQGGSSAQIGVRSASQRPSLINIGALEVSEHSLQTYVQMITNVSWMFFPYLELVVMTLLLQGISLAQASMLSSTCSPLASLGGILLIVPVLFLIFTAVVIRWHCTGNRSTLIYELDPVDVERSSRPIWKKLVEGVHDGYYNNESIFQFADSGSWYSRDGTEECMAAKAIRLGYDPLFADYNSRFPYFPCYMLLRVVVISFVTSVLTQSNPILLTLIAIACVFLVIIMWKRPFNNSVAGAAETMLLVADIVSITVLFCANYMSNAGLADVAMYIQLGFMLLIGGPLTFDTLCTMFSFLALWRRRAAAKLRERRQIKEDLRGKPDFRKNWAAAKKERRRRYRIRIRYIAKYFFPLLRVNAGSFWRNIKNALRGSLYGQRDDKKSIFGSISGSTGGSQRTVASQHTVASQP